MLYERDLAGWRRISADLLGDSAAVEALMGHTLADQRISSSRSSILYSLPLDMDCLQWRVIQVLVYRRNDSVSEGPKEPRAQGFLICL